MFFNLKGISPQLLSKTYLTMKSLSSRSVALQRALVQRPVTAHTPFNTPARKGRNFRQIHSRNYCSPSFIAPKPKATASQTGGSSTGNDNSEITTRNHAYYQRYSISGFQPIECTPPLLPKEPTTNKSQSKKTVHEHTCPINSYSHAYYQQFSIAGFHPMNNNSTDSKTAKKSPTAELREEHVCSIKTCNHDYYRVFSISGFYPAPSRTQTNSEPNKPTTISPEIDMAKALALAAAFTPCNSHQKTCDNMEHLNSKDNLNTCAQTIEELSFEGLGITGFQGARDDMEGEKCMEDDRNDDEVVDQAVEFREGGPDPVRAGLSPVWLLLCPI
ncbi:hypothetical protein BOTCAL_0120g00040 [Botryotinia calthae]|uniref:Uncharacterized protein n=1 Tax=Botryotinia calthae TaxID=38488 RepID=A0A4Y8D4J2_9HELO|nr:hypothetical protein BOTCAL_0120g00040 [Botryotinia calthae]